MAVASTVTQPKIIRHEYNAGQCANIEFEGDRLNTLIVEIGNKRQCYVANRRDPLNAEQLREQAAILEAAAEYLTTGKVEDRTGFERMWVKLVFSPLISSARDTGRPSRTHCPADGTCHPSRETSP